MKNISIEIARYFIDNDGALKITHIKVLDENGKYVKFASHEKILPYLHQLPVRFKKMEGEK